MRKLLFVIKSNYKFPKVQLPNWIMWDKGERPMEFPSRVHSCRMRGPGFALGEWALFEWGLRWAGFHAGSSSIAPCRERLAPFTSISWCLGLWTLIPGTRWKPWAISVTTHTVMSSLVRGVTELLALWPVALSSSSVPRQHLAMRLIGLATGVCSACRSLSWCRDFLVSTCKAGSRGTGGSSNSSSSSSRGITQATQGHRCNWATSRSGWIAVLWMGHLSKRINALL